MVKFKRMIAATTATILTVTSVASCANNDVMSFYQTMAKASEITNYDYTLTVTGLDKIIPSSTDTSSKSLAEAQLTGTMAGTDAFSLAANVKFSESDDYVKITELTFTDNKLYFDLGSFIDFAMKLNPSSEVSAEDAKKALKEQGLGEILYMSTNSFETEQSGKLDSDRFMHIQTAVQSSMKPIADAIEKNFASIKPAIANVAKDNNNNNYYTFTLNSENWDAFIEALVAFIKNDLKGVLTNVRDNVKAKDADAANELDKIINDYDKIFITGTYETVETEYGSTSTLTRSVIETLTNTYPQAYLDSLKKHDEEWGTTDYEETTQKDDSKKPDITCATQLTGKEGARTFNFKVSISKKNENDETMGITCKVKCTELKDKETAMAKIVAKTDGAVSIDDKIKSTMSSPMGAAGLLMLSGMLFNAQSMGDSTYTEYGEPINSDTNDVITDDNGVGYELGEFGIKDTVDDYYDYNSDTNVFASETDNTDNTAETTANTTEDTDDTVPMEVEPEDNGTEDPFNPFGGMSGDGETW